MEVVKAYYRSPKAKKSGELGRSEYNPQDDDELLYLAHYLLSIHDHKNLSAVNHKEWKKFARQI